MRHIESWELEARWIYFEELGARLRTAVVTATGDVRAALTAIGTAAEDGGAVEEARERAVGARARADGVGILGRGSAGAPWWWHCAVLFVCVAFW